MKELTWEEIKGKKSGTILFDKFDEGVRFIVLRGPGALCAYIGVPIDHPLSGFDYDDLSISCHGGLTFSGEGCGKMRPKGFWWYGWDYSHYDDYSFYYDNEVLRHGFDHSKEKKWLVEDVVKDSWEAIYEFKQLMKLAEKIKCKFLCGKNGKQA